MKSIVKRWLVAVLFAGAAVLTAQAQGPVLDPAFLLTSATGRPGGYAPIIRDMVRQPDGKLIVGGDFVALNGRSVVNLARLLPDGQVDTTFAALPVDGEVATLALQADGKLLVGGYFATVGGQSRIGIARLLPNGALDPSFLSPFGGGPPFSYSNVTKIALQPGRGILVFGLLIPIGSTGPGSVYAARLLEATGARDATFQPGFDAFDIRDVLVQPSGQLVFAGRERAINGRQCLVWGALPDGALDPAFVPLPSPTPSAFVPLAYGLARDPATGNLYVVAMNNGPGLIFEPVRLLPNGVRDPAFSTAGTFVPGLTVGAVNSVSVQPNGRLLVGGVIPVVGGGYFGSARLLPSGALDLSYDSRNGPLTSISKVLVPPDGALLFCGSFRQVGSLPVDCLARMLDANVLSAPAAAALPDALDAWPVPAREVLHLRWPTGRPARQVALLDGLGRVVRRQALTAGEPALALPTAGLPPGTYLLQVRFAQGPPAYRRVVVE